MNKECSLNIENEMSTQIGDTLKSYSSKYRQLKQMRSTGRLSIPQVLPIKLERAVITIQRFWRRRMALRNKVYSSINEELDKQNSLLQFENKSLCSIISIYQSDCRAREEVLHTLAERGT